MLSKRRKMRMMTMKRKSSQRRRYTSEMLQLSFDLVMCISMEVTELMLCCDVPKQPRIAAAEERSAGNSNQVKGPSFCGVPRVIAQFCWMCLEGFCREGCSLFPSQFVLLSHEKINVGLENYILWWLFFFEGQTLVTQVLVCVYGYYYYLSKSLWLNQGHQQFGAPGCAQRTTENPPFSTAVRNAGALHHLWLVH